MPMAIQRVGVNGMDELRFVSNLGLISSNLPIRGWTREMPVVVGSVQRGQHVHPFFCIFCTMRVRHRH